MLGPVHERSVPSHGLEKLTQLTKLTLDNNSGLTQAQIAELQKALPKCNIFHNATK